MRELVRVVVLTALIGVAGIFLGLGLVMTWPHLAPRATPVADRFDAPAHWELVTNRDEGASLICLGGNPCPSVHRAWVATASSVTSGLVARLGADAGWAWVVEGDCALTDGDVRSVVGGVTTCEARGVDDDGFSVRFVVDSDAADVEHVRAHLYVRPLPGDAGR